MPADDAALFDFLRSTGRDFLVIATKSDRLSANKLRPALNILARAHGVEEVLPYSVKTSAGKTELWRAIREHATEKSFLQ